MVHVPTRGDVPVRLGPGVRQIPDYGPSKMSRDVYTDPVRFDPAPLADAIIAFHRSRPR